MLVFENQLEWKIKMENELTQEEQNKIFRQVADTHIDLANSQMEAADLQIVTSGFVYGSTRFAAFSVASEAKDAKQYEASMEAAVEHYTRLFKNMLEENLENYKGSFKEEPRYAHLVKK